MKYKLIPILFFVLIITGCTERTKEIFSPNKNEKIDVKKIESIKVKITCNKGNIEKYLLLR